MQSANTTRIGITTCLVICGVVIGFMLGVGYQSQVQPSGPNVAPTTNLPAPIWPSFVPPPAPTLPIASEQIGPSPEVTTALLEKGNQLYEKQCAACHGDKGLGDGKAAYLLYPKPRDFTQVEFRLISTDNGVPRDEDLFRTITKGMPGSAMPPWGHLPAEERWALVHTVKKLAHDGKVERLVQKRVPAEKAERIVSDQLKPGSPLQVPPEPPLTLDSVVRGRQIFMANCAPCHGPDGRGGNSVEKSDLKDNSGFPISARDFTQSIFKGGSNGQDLARRFLGGMPGTPMPVFKDLFKTGEDLWGLIHFVQTFIDPGAQEKVEQSQRLLAAAKANASEEELKSPSSPLWQQARSNRIALMPLWWRDSRVDGLEIRAVHTDSKIALHLTWKDRSQNNHILRQTDFGDAVAVELASSDDPPFFGMGAKDHEVNIWHWKACWESDVAKHKDVQDYHPNMVVDLYGSLENPPFGRHSEVGEFPTAAHRSTFITGWGAGNLLSEPARTTSAEDLTAQGFSTLASQAKTGQNLQSHGVWADGLWQTVFVRDLAATDKTDVSLVKGKTIPIAFAVWDGEGGDRDGQKSVTIWHRLTLEDE